MRITIITFLFLISFCKNANAQVVIALYQGLAPGSLPVADKEVFTKPDKGRPFVSHVTNPTLTVFESKKPNSGRTSIIICPGGGFSRLSIEDGGYEAAKAFAEYGITAFVLKYRTWRDSAYADYKTAPMLDLQQAINIVYQGAAKWNLDTTKIGILGFSAGGHLAAMASTGLTFRKPAFSLLIYPVISFTDSLTSKTSTSRSVLLGANITSHLKKQYSPELHINKATPPAFLIHAADDSTALVGNSIAYFNGLSANRIPTQLHIYQKGGHGFALYNKMQDEYWMPSSIKWLVLNGFLKQ